MFFATMQAPAADNGNDDHVDRRLLLEDLKRVGGDAGDQQWLIARAQSAIPMLVGELFGVLPGVVEIVPWKTSSASSPRMEATLTGVGLLGNADRRGAG
jgi:hypothetical protein